MEELSDFPDGTFHQDMGSPKQALENFITEASKECLVFTIKFCEAFLNSDISEQEKESFIKSNSEIYFPAIELTPHTMVRKSNNSNKRNSLGKRKPLS
ncbi:contact-dependent growth inhibition system immunity protein [Bacillus amyloliquefaciens]|uniref:contact-dependent growth inhibition system immunity protein n=1 Tax=Bacillus amyloliquefaciens TaxID=1390 RepID=UPI003F49F56D